MSCCLPHQQKRTPRVIAHRFSQNFRFHRTNTASRKSRNTLTALKWVSECAFIILRPSTRPPSYGFTHKNCSVHDRGGEATKETLFNCIRPHVSISAPQCASWYCRRAHEGSLCLYICCDIQFSVIICSCYIVMLFAFVIYYCSSFNYHICLCHTRIIYTFLYMLNESVALTSPSFLPCVIFWAHSCLKSNSKSPHKPSNNLFTFRLL